MWFVLRQMVKVGTNQFKGFSNVSCHGSRSRTSIPLIQESYLCTVAATLRKSNLDTTILEKPAMHQKVELNPDIHDMPYILTKAQQDFIFRGSAENVQKFNELVLTLQTFREGGKELPETIKLEDLDIMLSLSYSKILRHLSFLMKNQYRIKNNADKKVESRKLLEQRKKERIQHESTLEHPWLERSSLIMPIHKGIMSCVYNSNSLSGLLFGQKVIIDCSYNSFMDDYCLKLTAKQILYCHYSSRKNRRPFSLHICNLDHDSRLMYYLQKLNPGLLHDIPIGIHSKSYLELFDRKKIVYLTPHTKNDLEYNPEDIYIIGGYVDKNQVALSRSKADKEKLRHAALPLHHYLKWRGGSKNLCLHHCLDILLDVKNTGDWSKALQTHVPTRKQAQARPVE